MADQGAGDDSGRNSNRASRLSRFSESDPDSGPLYTRIPRHLNNPSMSSSAPLDLGMTDEELQRIPFGAVLPLPHINTVGAARPETPRPDSPPGPGAQPNFNKQEFERKRATTMESQYREYKREHSVLGKVSSTFKNVKEKICPPKPSFKVNSFVDAKRPADLPFREIYQKAEDAERNEAAEKQKSDDRRWMIAQTPEIQKKLIKRLVSEGTIHPARLEMEGVIRPRSPSVGTASRRAPEQREAEVPAQTRPRSMSVDSARTRRTNREHEERESSQQQKQSDIFDTSEHQSEVHMSGTQSHNNMDELARRLIVTRGDPSTGGDPAQITIEERILPQTPARGHRRIHSVPESFRFATAVQATVGNGIAVPQRSVSLDAATTLSPQKNLYVIPDYRRPMPERTSSLAAPTTETPASVHLQRKLAKRNTFAADSPLARKRTRTFDHSAGEFYYRNGQFYHKDSNQHESGPSRAYGSDDGNDHDGSTPRQSFADGNVGNVLATINNAGDNLSTPRLSPTRRASMHEQSPAGYVSREAQYNGTEVYQFVPQLLLPKKRRKTVTFAEETSVNAGAIIAQGPVQSAYRGLMSSFSHDTSDSSKELKVAKKLRRRASEAPDASEKRRASSAAKAPFKAIGGSLGRLMGSMRGRNVTTVHHPRSSETAESAGDSQSHEDEASHISEIARDKQPSRNTIDHDHDVALGAGLEDAEDIDQNLVPGEAMLIRHLVEIDREKSLPALPQVSPSFSTVSDTNTWREPGTTALQRLLGLLANEDDKLALNEAIVSWSNASPDDFEEFVELTKERLHNHELYLPAELECRVTPELATKYEVARVQFGQVREEYLRRKDQRRQSSKSQRLPRSDTAADLVAQWPTQQGILDKTRDYAKRPERAWEASDDLGPRQSFEYLRAPTSTPGRPASAVGRPASIPGRRVSVPVPQEATPRGPDLPSDLVGDFAQSTTQEFDRIFETTHTPLAAPDNFNSNLLTVPPLAIRYGLNCTPDRATDGETPVWRDRAVTPALANSFDVYQIGARRSSGYAPSSRSVSGEEHAVLAQRKASSSHGVEAVDSQGHSQDQGTDHDEEANIERTLDIDGDAVYSEYKPLRASKSAALEESLFADEDEDLAAAEAAIQARIARLVAADDERIVREETLRRAESMGFGTNIGAGQIENVDEVADTPVIRKLRTPAQRLPSIVVKKTRGQDDVVARVASGVHNELELRQLLSREPLPSGQGQHIKNDIHAESGLVANLANVWECLSSPTRAPDTPSLLFSPTGQQLGTRHASHNITKRLSAIPQRSVTEVAQTFINPSSSASPAQVKARSARVIKLRSQESLKALSAAYYKSKLPAAPQPASSVVSPFVRGSQQQLGVPVRKGIARSVSATSTKLLLRTAVMTALPIQTNDEMAELITIPRNQPSFDTIDSLEDIIKFGTAYLEERAKSKVKVEKDVESTPVVETKVIEIMDLAQIEAERERSGAQDEDDGLTEEERRQRDADMALLLPQQLDGMTRTKITVEAPVIMSVQIDEIIERGATQAVLTVATPTSPKMKRPLSWYPSFEDPKTYERSESRPQTPRRQTPRQRYSRNGTPLIVPGCPFWVGNDCEKDPAYNQAVVESIMYRGYGVGEADQGRRTILVPIEPGTDVKSVLDLKFVGKGQILSATVHETAKLIGYNTLRVIFVNPQNFSPEEISEFSMVDGVPAELVYTRTAPIRDPLFSEISRGYTRTVIITGLPDSPAETVLLNFYGVDNQSKMLYGADPLLYADWDEDGNFVLEFASIKAAAKFLRAWSNWNNEETSVFCVHSACMANWETTMTDARHMASPQVPFPEELDYGSDSVSGSSTPTAEGITSPEPLEEGEIRGESPQLPPIKKMHVVNKPLPRGGRTMVSNTGSPTRSQGSSPGNSFHEHEPVTPSPLRKSITPDAPVEQAVAVSSPLVPSSASNLMLDGSPVARVGPIPGLPRSSAMMDLNTSPSMFEQDEFSANRATVRPRALGFPGQPVQRLTTPVLGTAPPSPTRQEAPNRLGWKDMGTHLAQSLSSRFGASAAGSSSSGSVPTPVAMGVSGRKKISYADIDVGKPESAAKTESSTSMITKTKSSFSGAFRVFSKSRNQAKEFGSSVDSFKTAKADSPASFKYVDDTASSSATPTGQGQLSTRKAAMPATAFSPLMGTMGLYKSPTGRQWDEEDGEDEVASPSEPAKVEGSKGKEVEGKEDESKDDDEKK